MSLWACSLHIEWLIHFILHVSNAHTFLLKLVVAFSLVLSRSIGIGLVVHIENGGFFACNVVKGLTCLVWLLNSVLKSRSRAIISCFGSGIAFYWKLVDEVDLGSWDCCWTVVHLRVKEGLRSLFCFVESWGFGWLQSCDSGWCTSWAQIVLWGCLRCHGFPYFCSLCFVSS